MSLVARFGLDTSKIRRCICPSNVSIGHLVAIVGNQNGIELVDKADPVHYERLPAVGMVISKIDATTCLVQFYGESPSIFNNLAPGEIYFLGKDSFISVVPPRPNGVDVFVQNVGMALSPTTIFIKPDLNLVLRRS